jgi:hypothetical protein
MEKGRGCETGLKGGESDLLSGLLRLPPPRLEPAERLETMPRAYWNGY